MGVTVSGQFTRFDAIIDLDPMKPETSGAKISVDVASLTTGDADADATAVDKPRPDLATFPHQQFTSTPVNRRPQGRARVWTPDTQHKAENRLQHGKKHT